MSRPGSRSEPLDVVVVGGGHNGLVAAGLLAKRGATVTVLERRPAVGGAAVTEQPWGHGFRVSTLSYVVGLMPPALVRELGLERHGYSVRPQGPYFAPRAEGGYLALPDDPRARHEHIARFSRRDADEYERWHGWISRIGSLLAPLLTTTPPALGSHRLGDLLDTARLAWCLRGWDVRATADVTRLFTESVADVVEERFESDAVRGVLAVSGVIGAWAGPRSPGTAYVLAHHKLGQGWGFPRGGMGAVTTAMRAAAESSGACIRTGVEVTRILVHDGTARGVLTADGEEVHAETVLTTTHPHLTFLRQLDPSELPPAFLEDIRRWRSRSGVVKVNVAVDRLPCFSARPEFDPDLHGGTIVLAESLDDIEAAFRDAVGGCAARLPFADICIPSVFDPTLAPAGKHVVSMFTQWVPHEWARAPRTEELEAHADRVVTRLDAVAPGFADSVLHRQVIGPYELERTYGLVGGNIFHGELSPSQLFHLRPAPSFADYRTPIRGLYQASSATHGGGGVTGIPGMRAADRIARDHGRRRAGVLSRGAAG